VRASNKVRTWRCEINWCSESIRSILQVLTEEEARRVAIRTHNWRTDGRRKFFCTMDVYIVFKKPRRLSSFKPKPWSQLRVEHWEPFKFADWPQIESNPACGFDINYGTDISCSPTVKRPRVDSQTHAQATEHTLLRSVLLSHLEPDMEDTCSVTSSSAERSSITACGDHPGDDSPPAQRAPQRAPPGPLEQACAILDAALQSMSEDVYGLSRGFSSAAKPGEAPSPQPTAEPDLLERFGLSDIGSCAHMPSCWTLPLTLAVD